MEAVRYSGFATPRLVASPIPYPPPRKTSKFFPKTTCSASKWADRLLSDFQFFATPSENSSDLQHSLSSSTATLVPPPLPPTERHLSIPLHFYQVLGAETHFLGDGIRRAYESRVSKPPQYGFSQDALVSRRQILQAACETLADPKSRREYNQGLIDDEEETIITEIPWDKVPGALCVLQEAGDTEVVLEIGESLLRERLPKSFKQDVVLAMALAFVDISRDAMAFTPPDFVSGSEMLERALKLLQEEGASNLAPDLQAQIDETLEEIAPQCVLELLALPLGDEYRTKRAEGLHGVRNILWTVGGGGAAAVAGGFTREDFMNEAFLRMTAAEQVDLFTATPNNIPAESFEVYAVALALVAQAFIGKKPQLIADADGLFRQLQQIRVTGQGNPASVYNPKQNHEIDFALERGLCSLLVGEIDECRAWFGLDSDNSPYRNPQILDFMMENSQDDDDSDLPGLCKLLEIWLMEVVFPRFRDTKNMQCKLGDYYDDPTVLRYLERQEGGGRSPLAAAAAIVKIGAEATAVIDNVRASAIQALQKVFSHNQDEKNIELQERDSINYPVPAVEGEEYPEQHDPYINAAISGKYTYDEVPEEVSITDSIKDASVKIMGAGAAIAVLTLIGLRFSSTRKDFVARNKEISSATTSGTINVGIAVDDEPVQGLPRMDARFAEGLVRKWQNIKSLAFGSNHSLEKLPDVKETLLSLYAAIAKGQKHPWSLKYKVLDGEMLKTWTERAAEIAQLGWVYDYTLLDLTIDSVTVSVDGQQAVVEATLKELACLTDPVHPENNASKNTTYTTRYEMSCTNSGWKITGGAIMM